VTVGAIGGSSGTVVVSGSEALLSQGPGTAAPTVGSAGQGTLEILNDGTFVTDEGMTVGNLASASGTVVVSGAGSELINNTNTTGVRIGQGGPGMLLVQSSGSVFSGGPLVMGGFSGGPEGGTGLISVTGASHAETDSSGYIWAGSTLSVDATSGVDWGGSGAFVAGAVNIESGRSLAGDGLVLANVVNDGMIEALGSTAPGT
jgi:T5SS/PEP-CTERM-associated repeat protein